MASPGNLFLFSVSLLPLFFSYSNSYKFYAGGRDGWVLKPSEDYNQWAGRNRFQVNDTIYFKYEKGSDSVLVVNKQDYETCNTKNPIKKFEDGNSEFKFDRSGPFYFISGEADRCKNGQKLVVVVLAIRPILRPPVLPPKASPPYPVTQPPSVFPSPPEAQPPQTPTSPPSGAPSPTAVTPASSSPTPSATPVSPSYSPTTSPSPSESTPISPSPAPSTSPVSPSESPESKPPSASPPNPLSPPSPAGAETTPSPAGPGGSADTSANPPPGGNGSAANSLMVVSVTTAISVAFGCFLAVY